MGCLLEDQTSIPGGDVDFFLHSHDNNGQWLPC
jgi:hypothetical protein